MSAKRTKSVVGPNSSRDDMAVHINHALATSNLVQISRSIREVIQLHGVANIAKKSGIERTSLYRSFRGTQYPSFKTVLNVLDAMGLQLKVTVRARAEDGSATPLD